MDEDDEWEKALSFGTPSQPKSRPRRALNELVLFWEPLGKLTDEERGGFTAAVSALVQRFERRQQLEEQELFPACDRYVGADDQLDWLEAFAQLEVERGCRSEWSDKIDALTSRWLG